MSSSVFADMYPVLCTVCYFPHVWGYWKGYYLVAFRLFKQRQSEYPIPLPHESYSFGYIFRIYNKLRYFRL